MEEGKKFMKPAGELYLSAVATLVSNGVFHSNLVAVYPGRSRSVGHFRFSAKMNKTVQIKK